MKKKILIVAGLLLTVYSLSMCKNIFSAFSEPVDEADFQRITLPKTGQTTCYEPSCTASPCPTVSCAGTGEDGEYQMGVSWPNPRFKDNGDGTVIDRLTGLMWIKAPDAAQRTWYEALNYVRTLTTGGYSDWRLPNNNELKSLTHYGQASPGAWLNTQGFTGIQSAFYWSATTDVNNSVQVYYLNFNNNLLSLANKATAYYVLAVRFSGGGAVTIPRTGQTTCYDASNTVTSCSNTAGQDGNYQRGSAWPSPRFRDNGNGTVTDRLTGLMWIKAPDATQRSWQVALIYVRTLTTGGYSDWRLPNISELASLVHYGQSNPAVWLNSQGFTGIIISLAYYWSASTLLNDPKGGLNVEMNSGRINSSEKHGGYYVIAVRGGQ